MYCLVNNGDNIKRRQHKQRSVFDDDCGVWQSADGKTTKFPYLENENGDFKRLFVVGNKYCYEKFVSGRRTYVSYHPQPHPEDVTLLCRYYTALKGKPDVRKRVSWIEDRQNSSHRQHVAVVEYNGDASSTLPHGNAKKRKDPYVRTSQKTINIIAESANTASSTAVYDDLVDKMDIDDAPRDPRVVKNKKYNMQRQSRNAKRLTYRQNFADEVQSVCSMVATDDFVQCVTVAHDVVPCIILHNSRQMKELKAYCFDNDGCVLSFDKTYNLGKVYVTVSVYRNLALRRAGSGDIPIFIGPLFVHGNSDFHTYANFFGYLSSRLYECDGRKLRLGCDEEASIRKAMRHFFPNASAVTCTRHLKENFIRNANKVTTSNDQHVSYHMQLIQTLLVVFVPG